MSDDYFDPNGFRDARPARHTDPRARSGHTGVVSLDEIEERIIRCDSRLEELVDEHYEASRVAAEAEADWKTHRDRVLVQLANSGDKEAADIREARAKRSRVDGQDPSSPTGEDLYRAYRIHEARVQSLREALRATSSRMSGLQSVAKGIRSAGG